MTTFAPAKLSEKRYMTADGFLLCKDVRLARVGEMLYRGGETPVPAGPDGIARIERSPEVVFAQDTMDSFVGMPITIKHPASKVTPATWKEHANGHILTARRGDPPFSDFMVGDILVTSKDAIDLANAGCELSLGYDAAYEATGVGRGKQTRIVGNHLAFLPDGIKGRCGPMCYVGDQSMDLEEPETMTTKPNFGSDFLKRLFGVQDEAGAQALIAEMQAEESKMTTDQAIKSLTDTVAKLSATIDEMKKDKEEEETEDEDDKSETKDSFTMDANAVSAFRARVVSAAEILSPGFTIPTMDAAGDLKTTHDSLCACQKEALTKSYATEMGKAAITAMVGDKFDVSAMTKDQLDATFFGASSLLGAMRNGSTLAAIMGATVSMPQNAHERSVAAQKASDEKWAKRREARNQAQN